MTEDWKRRVVEAARGVLARNRTLTERASELAALAREASQSADTDLIVFVGIDSETDAFPVGTLREIWHPDALPELDRERETYEAKCWGHAQKAALSLIQRFE